MVFLKQLFQCDILKPTHLRHADSQDLGCTALGLRMSRHTLVLELIRGFVPRQFEKKCQNNWIRLQESWAWMDIVRAYL